MLRKCDSESRGTRTQIKKDQIRKIRRQKEKKRKRGWERLGYNKYKKSPNFKALIMIKQNNLKIKADDNH